jgi:hypothetical protein
MDVTTGSVVESPPTNQVMVNPLLTPKKDDKELVTESCICCVLLGSLL